MIATAAYNEAVRRYFADPQHSGDLQEDYDMTLVADASESDHGARVSISVGIRAGTIAGMAYRVWGCPYLIAALEAVCLALEKKPPGSLENFDAADITRELSIPIEKSGRILLLEDALAMLWAQYAGTEN